MHGVVALFGDLVAAKNFRIFCRIVLKKYCFCTNKVKSLAFKNQEQYKKKYQTKPTQSMLIYKLYIIQTMHL